MFTDHAYIDKRHFLAQSSTTEGHMFQINTCLAHSYKSSTYKKFQKPQAVLFTVVC